MKRSSSAFFLGQFCFFLCLYSGSTAYDAPGDLDTSFAGTGKSRIGFGFGQDVGRALALQSDGKLVMAGASDDSSENARFAVVRLGSDGLLDPSFGDAGKVITPIGIAPSF